MCCFSGRAGVVKLVAQTNLFARSVGERQLLAYSMNVAADEPVAMILPLPVPPSSPEEAVRFIDLSGYPSLFGDLDAGFPEIALAAPASRGGPSRGGSFVRQLTVHKVGAFIASFVPSLADFARLDERFRISDEVWRALPEYRDWGFAVFKLTELERGWFGRAKPKTIHPMAFEFPRRHPSHLFFPTVHIHDGAVHPEADFDHTFYYQAPAKLVPSMSVWFHAESTEPAASFVDAARSAGLVDGAARVHRAILRGRRPNSDVYFFREEDSR